MQVAPIKYDPDAPLRHESVLALDALQSTVEFRKLPEMCHGRWEYERLLEIILGHFSISFPNRELREDAAYPDWYPRIGYLRRMILRDVIARESLPEVVADVPLELGIPFSAYQRATLRSLGEESTLMSRTYLRGILMLDSLNVRPEVRWLQETIHVVSSEDFLVELM